MKMEVELKGIKEALEMYDPKKVRQATRSTLDKTMTFMKRRLITLVTELYNLPATEVRSATKSVRTTMTELVATLKISGKRISLVKFPYAQMPKGVAASIKLGKSFFIPHGFVQTMSTGFKGVFKRAGKFKFKIIPNVKHRNPAGVRREIIRHYPGPSIPEIVGSEGFKPIVEKEAGEHMEKLLMEEIEKRIYK